MFLTDKQVRKMVEKFNKQPGGIAEIAKYLNVPQWRVKAYFKYHTLKMSIKNTSVKTLTNLFCCFVVGWWLAQYLTDLHIYRMTSAANNMAQTAAYLQKICESDQKFCDLTSSAIIEVVKHF